MQRTKKTKTLIFRADTEHTQGVPPWIKCICCVIVRTVSLPGSYPRSVISCCDLQNRPHGSLQQLLICVCCMKLLPWAGGSSAVSLCLCCTVCRSAGSSPEETQSIKGDQKIWVFSRAFRELRYNVCDVVDEPSPRLYPVPTPSSAPRCSAADAPSPPEHTHTQSHLSI